MDPLIFLFDVDGVIAETPQEQAWKAAAVEWGIISPEFEFAKFYASHIAGEPGGVGAACILEHLREEGSRSYFERHGISDECERRALATRLWNPTKKRYLDEAISRGDFRVFCDIAAFVLYASATPDVLVGAVSSSENAESVLRAIRAEEISACGICPGEIFTTLFDVFDTTALGCFSHWHGAWIEKANHYAMAYGKALAVMPFSNIPQVVVFDDSPKGIDAVTRLGFSSVGICRRSSSGAELASKDQMYAAGASLAYDETELDGLGYHGLMQEITSALRT